MVENSQPYRLLAALLRFGVQSESQLSALARVSWLDLRAWLPRLSASTEPWISVRYGQVSITSEGERAYQRACSQRAWDTGYQIWINEARSGLRPDGRRSTIQRAVIPRHL